MTVKPAFAVYARPPRAVPTGGLGCAIAVRTDFHFSIGDRFMRVGMLTGGGDCPGLNPAIRGATLRLLDFGHEVLGFTRGWAGLVEGTTMPLTLDVVEPIISEGGTILRSSRTNPFKP